MRWYSWNGNNGNINSPTYLHAVEKFDLPYNSGKTLCGKLVYQEEATPESWQKRSARKCKKCEKLANK